MRRGAFDRAAELAMKENRTREEEKELETIIERV